MIVRITNTISGYLAVFSVVFYLSYANYGYGNLSHDMVIHSVIGGVAITALMGYLSRHKESNLHWFLVVVASIFTLYAVLYLANRNINVSTSYAELKVKKLEFGHYSPAGSDKAETTEKRPEGTFCKVFVEDRRNPEKLMEAYATLCPKEDAAIPLKKGLFGYEWFEI